MQFHGGGAQYRYPIGYDAYLMYSRDVGAAVPLRDRPGRVDLAAVAIAQRAWAERNERAYRREPLTLESYLAAPFVVEPYRAADCTVEVDGACAVVVTAARRCGRRSPPPGGDRLRRRTEPARVPDSTSVTTCCGTTTPATTPASCATSCSAAPG